jgi:hypothetical protein
VKSENREARMQKDERIDEGLDKETKQMEEAEETFNAKNINELPQITKKFKENYLATNNTHNKVQIGKGSQYSGATPAHDGPLPVANKKEREESMVKVQSPSPGANPGHDAPLPIPNKKERQDSLS